MEAITIDASNADQRFDRFLRKYFKPYPDITLGDIFRWIRKRNILVNNRKTKENTRLQIGDVITFHIQSLDDRFKTAPTKTAKTNLIHTQEIAEHIIYQDTNRIVRNKPPHMVVHGGNHHENDLSLQDLLRIYCERMTITDPEIIGTFQPSLCYRLDRDTSGVLVSAITYPALQHLNQQIRDRLVTKTYRAILVGHAPDHRIADEPLFK
jgi:23S rRNA pseudouridine955/2504/2580 synthase